MAGSKAVLILLVVFCLVSKSLAMSLTSKDPKEDSAAARYFRKFEEKSMITIKVTS